MEFKGVEANLRLLFILYGDESYIIVVGKFVYELLLADAIFVLFSGDRISCGAFEQNLKDYLDGVLRRTSDNSLYINPFKSKTIMVCHADNLCPDVSFDLGNV